jgi:hypothetical protein
MMKLEKRLKVRMQISAFWLDQWCKHFVEVWRDSYIEDLTVSMSFDLLD